MRLPRGVEGMGGKEFNCDSRSGEDVCMRGRDRWFMVRAESRRAITVSQRGWGTVVGRVGWG